MIILDQHLPKFCLCCFFSTRKCVILYWYFFFSLSNSFLLFLFLFFPFFHFFLFIFFFADLCKVGGKKICMEEGEEEMANGEEEEKWDLLKQARMWAKSEEKVHFFNILKSL